jgi:hypothetical protein
LLTATAARAQSEQILSGRELLKVMRQRDGRSLRPAYENRFKGPAEPQIQEPLVTDVETTPTVEAPTEPTIKPPSRPVGDRLLRLVPAEGMFCVRVNHFDYTLNQLDQFLTGVSPLPMGLSILARTQLAKLLGSPELTGVNMGGTFALFGAALPAESTQAGPVPSMFIALLIPVTDYEQFVGGNQNVSQLDDKGISNITSEDMPPMLTAPLAGYALVSSADNYDKLVAMVSAIKSIPDERSAGLAATLDADHAKQAIEQPIWAYGNIHQASTTFGPLVLGKIEETKTMMEEIKAAGQAPMGDPAAAMEMCAGILDVLMKQTNSLSIAVNPKPNVLNITNTVAALPGTDMADMFTADSSTKQENNLLGYLEDGAMINASGRVTGKLNAKAMDFFATVISKDMSPEDKAKIKSLASDIATVFSGNDAMSFSVDPKNKPPFAGTYITEIKDKDKVNKLIEEGTALFNTGCVADFYESLGLKPTFTLSRGADSYKGVSIDSAKLVMKSTDPNSPQAQMIVAMYGDGFNYRWGAVDGLWVCAYGGKVDSPIRELIDLVKAGGPKQMAAEIKTALALLPDADKADFFVTYNYVRLLKMLPAMMGAMMPVPMPEIDIPTKSNIVLAGKIGGGKMTIDIALPKEHLTEIVAAFTMMMQQKTQIQQPQSQGRLRKTPTSLTDRLPRGNTWVMCSDPNCGAEYEITKREYFLYIETHSDSTMMEAPLLPCKKCGQETVYRAVKCEKCGLVFKMGSKPFDFEDRCPACGHSKIEQDRRRAHRARKAR